MLEIFYDLRSSFRTLRRRPFYPFMAVVILALGLSASVAVFTYINGFYQPFPGVDAGGLVRVFGVDNEDGFQDISYLDFLDYAAEGARDLHRGFVALDRHEGVFALDRVACGNQNLDDFDVFEITDVRNPDFDLFTHFAFPFQSLCQTLVGSGLSASMPKRVRASSRSSWLTTP